METPDLTSVLTPMEIPQRKYAGSIDVIGYRPFKHQMAVHEVCDKHKSNSVIVVKSRRQVGKSMMLLNELLRTACVRSESTSICVSPSFQQAKKMYDDLKCAVISSCAYRRHNDSELEIRLKNGSKILFKSAGSADTLRGFTTTKGILVVDEAAFITDEVFYGILLPMTNVYSSNVILCSTPKFKKGFFYDYYQRGLNGEKNIYTIDFCEYDTSMLLSTEQLNEYQRMLPKMQFLNEYMGQFMDANSEVFGDFEDLLIERNTASCTGVQFGVDWGSGTGKDYTAIAIINDSKQMIDIVYFNDKDVKTTIDTIAQLAEKYKPLKITVEKNSIGQIYFDLLKKKLSNYNVVPFVTDNESKNKIINNLQLLIENKAVRLIDDFELKNELAMYQLEQTRTGKTTYNAQKGCHDDLVIATAIAFYSTITGHYIIR